MNSYKPKVLMLGWEFPPIINGGLGVACHDLCSSLSSHADISMIIPTASASFKQQHLDLIGLNNISDKSILNTPVNFNYDSLKDVNYIQSDLDPYVSEKSFGNTAINKSYFTEPGIENVNIFNNGNLYNDVVSKVKLFSRLATKIALKKDFDVIHAHDWMTMLAGMEIKSQTGKPLVVHVHSLEIDRTGEESRGWVYQMEKEGMMNADLLLPVSNFTASNITNHYNIDQSKIFTVHNGVRYVKTFKTKSPFHEKTVLFIGRLTRQKGPEHFLEIASKVHERDEDVRFIMAGTGDYFRSLLEKSAYKHLGNRFHLTGFLDQAKLHNLLSFADAYCMPSVSEPFGLSAVEAAQFGVPCVISKQSGVAEVLKGALRFDFWDTDKAASQLLSVLNDKTLKEKVVSDAYRDLQNISWDLSAKKIIDAYSLHNVVAN